MKTSIFYIFVLFSFLGSSQETIKEVLNKYNKNDIPYLSAKELSKSEAIILDAREQKEFNVSHIKNAIYVGYNEFQLKIVLDTITNKNEKIVVYCTIGVRSEDIAEQLKDAGYTNVYNLFGGIFEWKNNGFLVFNSKNKTTDKVHTFSKEWSKWLKKGIKTYE